MLELLFLLLGVYWIGKTFGDDAGVVALVILLIAVAALFIRGWRDGGRAYWNFIRYWRDGGPDKK